MHGIAIAILKYGYLDDNTALRRYSASCGPDHDSRISKKKALFLNIFMVTLNSPVSMYRSIFVAAATVFPACYRGTTCGKADHPLQPYLVRGDQMWWGTNCGVTGPYGNTKINGPDVSELKVYHPQKDGITVHQSRVKHCPTRCPINFPAGFYWYGAWQK